MIQLRLTTLFFGLCGLVLLSCTKYDYRPAQLQDDPDALGVPTKEDLVLLDAMELARVRALKIVNRLIAESDPDRFLGQAVFCTDSAYICDKLEGLDEDGKRAFIESNFLTPEGFLKERSALTDAKFFVTSVADRVKVNGVTVAARADASKKEIRFYRPWVETLTPIEKVTLLLHEIWHHLGLPDEGAYGPYLSTRSAIDAAASSQAAYWMGHDVKDFPERVSNFIPLQSWIQRQPVAAATWTNSCGSVGTGIGQYSNPPNTCRFSPTNLKLNNFYLATSASYVVSGELSQVRWHIKIDSKGAHYIIESIRPVTPGGGSGGSVVRLLFYDGTQETELGTYAADLQILFWNGRLKLMYGADTILEDRITEPGGFAVEVQNATAQMRITTPF